ncbi:MAG: diheme cytochrome c-553 [Chryseolinea sp.]
MKVFITTIAMDRSSIAKGILLRTYATTAAIVAALILFSCSRPQDPGTVQAASLPAEPTQEQLIQRGSYLTTVMLCNDCHTPKIMTEHGPVLDTARRLSGHPSDEKLAPIPPNRPFVLFTPGLTAAVGPWGASFAANLTPDPLGLGGWSYDQFKTAITHGKYRGIEGGRSLLPPMPWENLVNIHDEDARAIFAFLQSLKPIPNRVPAPIAPQDLILEKAM